MTEVFQHALLASESTVGWLAWEVTLKSADQRNRTYCLGEHEGVESAAEAVRAAFEMERDADRCFDGATVIIQIRELRVLVYAELHPN